MRQLIYMSSVTPFGFPVTGKLALMMDCISHPVLEEPLHYGMTLDLASLLFTKINVCLFTPFWGLVSGEMQHLQYYCLHWSFRTREP